MIQWNLNAKIEGWEDQEEIVVWNGQIYIPIDKKL